MAITIPCYVNCDDAFVAWKIDQAIEGLRGFALIRQRNGNDENFLIIENHPALAAAYTVNIMSIYNQYRWRFRSLQSPGIPPFLGTEDNDTWQYDYLKGEKAREMEFWVSGS